MSARAWGGATAIAVILFALWAGGSFDRALAPLGLSSTECATNAFGATFCGDDLDRYERNIAAPAREAQEEVESFAFEVETEERALWREEEAAIIESGGAPCVGEYWEPGCGW